MSDGIAIDGWVKLGSAVRDARLSQRLTQTELASRAGVARSWLARVEAGHRNAELEPLFRLVRALGLTLSLDPAEGEPKESADQDIAESIKAAGRARRLSWASMTAGHTEAPHG